MRRLLPSAMLVVTTTVVAGRFLLSPFQEQSLVRDALASTFYVFNYRLAAQGTVYQELATAPSALQHLWSLSVEEQFYLIWPALIALCLWIAHRNVQRDRSRLFLAGLLVVLGTLSLVLSARITPTDPSTAYFSLQTRAWEFCVGAGVALIAPLLARLPSALADLLSWSGLTAVLVAATCYGAATPFPGLAALLPVLGAGASIAGGCRPAHAAPGRRAAGRLLRWAPAQWVGTLSYDWYLWHWPVLILGADVAGHSLPWPVMVGLCVAALGAAWGSFTWVGKPARALSFGRAAWAGTGTALLAATVAVCAIAWSTLPDLDVGSGRVVPAATATTLPPLLTKALTVQRVPADLTPVLSKASDDTPISTRDASNCYAGLLVVSQPACVYGDPTGRKTIALIGDSHAQQWLPALDDYALAHHIKVVSWTKSACSLADLPEINATLHKEYTQCDQWRSATIARVLALRPSLVVVSQSDNIPARQYSNQDWATATAAMMQTWTRSHLAAVYIMDTPLALSDVPTCVAEHLSEVRACDRANDSTKYKYSGRHQAVEQALQRAGIPEVEPLNWLCTAKECPTIIDGILVYRDSSHLTATFSRFLASLMAAAIKAGGLAT